MSEYETKVLGNAKVYHIEVDKYGNPIIPKKIVQITATNRFLFALDEHGEIYKYESDETGKEWSWEKIANPLRK